MLIRISAWNLPASLTRWWQATRSDAGIEISHIWTSEEMGWGSLQWENVPLTPDGRHWQEVNKILEFVDLKFENDLTDDEKTAFGEHVYALTKQVQVYPFRAILLTSRSTMSSCWSGDVDEEPVVHAKTLVWTTTEDAPSSCLLFLAWAGTEQRRAWLHNFMAGSFDWTGHIAHTLGAVCSSVGSGAYKMDTLYTWQETRDSLSRAYEEGDDDSDIDMGF